MRLGTAVYFISARGFLAIATRSRLLANISKAGAGDWACCPVFLSAVAGTIIILGKYTLEAWYIFKLYCYLPDGRFQYKYNTYSPALKSINNTPKATKPPPKLKRADIMVNARPPKKHTPGKLLVNALNLNLIILPSRSCFGSIENN